MTLKIESHRHFPALSSRCFGWPVNLLKAQGLVKPDGFIVTIQRRQDHGFIAKFPTPLNQSDTQCAPGSMAARFWPHKHTVHFANTVTMWLQHQNADWLAIEVKRARGTSDDLNQLRRYLDRVSAELAGPGDSVYGALCCFGADTAARVEALEDPSLEIMSWIQLGMPWHL